MNADQGVGASRGGRFWDEHHRTGSNQNDFFTNTTQALFGYVYDIFWIVPGTLPHLNVDSGSM